MAREVEETLREVQRFDPSKTPGNPALIDQIRPRCSRTSSNSNCSFAASWKARTARFAAARPSVSRKATATRLQSTSAA